MSTTIMLKNNNTAREKQATMTFCVIVVHMKVSRVDMQVETVLPF